MPSKACETLLHPAVSHILRLVWLPGQYHNTHPKHDFEGIRSCNPTNRHTRKIITRTDIDACDDRGQPHFSFKAPQFGSLKDALPKKNDLKKNKTAARGKNPNDLRRYTYNTRIISQKHSIFRLLNFRRFWVKEPRRSETIFAQKKTYENHHAKNIFFFLNFRRFWIKEPRHAETIFSDEKCYPLYPKIIIQAGQARFAPKIASPAVGRQLRSIRTGACGQITARGGGPSANERRQLTRPRGGIRANAERRASFYEKVSARNLPPKPPRSSCACSSPRFRRKEIRNRL